ncbi:MAG: 30S ribosomal protein S1 [Candidatus Acidiferrales bacterium]|jgi:small subunit ribosomal protein S1
MFSEAETPTAEHAEETSPAAEPQQETPAAPVVAAVSPAPETEPAHAADAQKTAAEIAVEVPGNATIAPSSETTSDAGAADASATGEADASASMEEAPLEMEQLLEQYAAPQHSAAEGEIESGQVVAVTNLGVVVSLGGKTEGLILAQEITEAEEPIKLDPGQPLELIRTGDHKEGYAVYSHLRALRRRAWMNIEKAYREKTDLTGKVVDRIKGGLVVNVGVRAFLPASQMDLRPVANLDEFKDQEITVRVVKLNRKRGNVVVSRRAILEEQSKVDRQKLLDSLEEGQVRRGMVKNVTAYGAFIDLGGLDGLLHVTDMSWGRVTSPSEIVRPGDDVEVKVLKYDKEKARVALGLKQLAADPWLSVVERYAVGTKLPGKVVSVVDYGAFVEIEPGIDGLVHASEMSWSKRKLHPSKVVKPGDAVEVVVLGVDPAERRISLGMKQTQTDPWMELVAKYPVGTVVTGVVRNLTEFGAFVEIEEGFDGLIHVSDISWTGRVKSPADVLKKGDTVKAKVLKIEPSGRRVSLGIKQVNDVWANWCAEHKVGSLAHGKVTRLTTFGAFVALAEGIEGLCHISEIEERHKGERSQAPMRGGAKSGEMLHVGQSYDFKIVKIQPDQHKIGLSFRAAIRQAEKRDLEDYRSSKSSATATIGDAILAKRELLS